MIKLNCAICGKKQKIKILYPARFSKKKLTARIFSARRTPDGTHFRLVKCQNCSLIFSSPILTEKKINNYYDDSDFTYKEESEYLKKTYGKLLVDLVGQRPSDLRGLSLLDTGCGNGFFLEEAKRLGVQRVYGIEPGPASVKKAKQDIKRTIKIGYFKKGIYKNNFFDIVTCFQTLDHIVNPNIFLKTVREVLKPQGKALFVVHNTDGASVKLLGEKSPIFDIEHIYLFNKKSLRLIFEKQNFKNVQVFDLANTYPLSYWTRMFPIPKFLRLALLKLFKLTKIANIPITLSAGNIAVIAQR